jgi:hypothetical protein
MMRIDLVGNSCAETLPAIMTAHTIDNRRIEAPMNPPLAVIRPSALDRGARDC